MSYYDDSSLFVAPNGYKTSVLFAQKPMDANGQLAFTRSNDTATRVAENGLIQKVRTNLVLQSNSFTTSWTATNATLTSGQAGYDGTSNGWLFTSLTAANSSFQQFYAGTTEVQTLSVYLKAGTTNWIRLNLSGAGNYFFDIQNGVVGSSGTAGLMPTITAAGNGYYRCSITNTVGNSVNSIYVFAGASDGVLSTSAGDTFYIQAVQREAGDIATDYIPTTTAAVSVGPVANLPRLNYPINSDGSVGCPSLLLEPQRTNVCLWSEQFDNAAWIKQTDTTISSNATTSPDGYTNADKLVNSTSVNRQAVYQDSSLTGVVSFSVFAKKAEYDVIQLTDGRLPTFFANFDLTNGVLGSFVGYTASIQDYGNGWYRCAVSADYGASTINQPRISLAQTTTEARLVEFAGSGTDGVFLYGAQVEAGAYATSYIPTLGAAVTRGADACSKTGISSLIGQTEGTMFLETNKEMDATLERIFNIYSTTSPTFDNITISKTTSNVISVSVRKNNVLTTYSPSFTGTIRKLALAYSTASNGLALYVNGTQLFLNTNSGNFSTTLSEIYIGSLRPSISTSDLYNGGINQALLFPTRLTNQELQDLTTL